MLLLNHDIHIHTYLSACCTDKTNHVPDKILKYAFQTGLHTVGFSDHIWVNPSLTPSKWYQKQDASQIDKIKQDIFSTFSPVKVLLGCEAETIAPGKFGITKEFTETIDYVLLACSHFHMTGFVQQPFEKTPRAVANNLLVFFRSAVKSGLANIIPHPFFPCGYEDIYDKTISTISDEEFLDVFGTAAENHIAIEISAVFLPPCMGGCPTRPEFSVETPMRILSLALQAGCLFSLGSDAHSPQDMKRLALLQFFIEKLNLKAKDFWINRCDNIIHER